MRFKENQERRREKTALCFGEAEVCTRRTQINKLNNYAAAQNVESSKSTDFICMYIYIYDIQYAFSGYRVPVPNSRMGFTDWGLNHDDHIGKPTQTVR